METGLDRRQYLGGLGATLASGLAGCMGGDGDSDNSQALDFWLFGGIPAEREYISGNYDSYEAHNVSYQHQEWGQKYQIIASAATNNNLPDVMAGQCQQIPDYVGANVDTMIYEGLGDTDGERQWGLPGGYADLGPFIDIRTDYFERTSFDEPPRTWPELVQLGEEMQEMDGFQRRSRRLNRISD